MEGDETAWQKHSLHLLVLSTNVADEVSLTKLCESFDKPGKIPNAHFLIGVKFDFPDYDWATICTETQTFPALPSRQHHR